MRKIYLTLSLVAAFMCNNAQVTLTKAFNEPVIGDLYVKASYDSVTAVPKNTGAGQLWNFSTFTAGSFTETSTFTTVASAPNASVFPAATVAENQGGSNYTMYKSSGSNWEVQGINSNSGGAVVNFTNTGIFATWPIAFGYSNSDVAGGTGSSSGGPTSISANISTSASGSGTVMLPGGVTINNILQVIQTITVSQTTGTMTGGFIQTTYDYYSSTQKFPVISIQYKPGGFNAFINKNVVAGLTEHSLSNDFSVYPNPAHDRLNLTINNKGADNVTATISDLLGREMKSISLGNKVNVSETVSVKELAKGIYVLKLTNGVDVSTRKIIIE